MDEILKKIENDIKRHKVVLYMKGTKLMPLCGFSARVVDILNEYEVSFETRNVLDDDELRSGIKEFSNWPTLPQLYIAGEFIGGCDIVTELHANGELEKMLASTSPATK